MRQSYSVLAALLCCGVLPAAPLLPEALELEGKTLKKQGEGSYRYLLWRVYTGAYYIGHATPDSATDLVNEGDAAAARPAEALLLHYHRSIDAEDLVKAGNTFLRRNLEPPAWEALQPQLAELNAAYVDVEEGDRYTLLYLPGEATLLIHNDVVLTRVEGAGFGPAYLRIWLGDAPLSKGFKAALLGAD